MTTQQKLLPLVFALAFVMAGSVSFGQVATSSVVQCDCGQAQCNSCATTNVETTECGCGETACTSCATAAPAPAVCGCNKPNCLGCLRSKIKACRCNKPNCRTCRVRTRPCRSCNASCGAVECPSCDEEICKLELDKGKSKKTCFKVEQKTICVPPVRFPWQKCCPPGTSKTKLVNRLSVHKYECPSCSYKWTVQEPETPEAQPMTAPQAPPTYETYPVEQHQPMQQPMQLQQPVEIQPIPAEPQTEILIAPQTTATPAPRTRAIQVTTKQRTTLTPRETTAKPAPITTLTPTWRVDSPVSSGR